MARRVEPPTHYVQLASKAKKLQLALTAKKKTKVAATEKK
jgi:hypothetical protein